MMNKQSSQQLHSLHRQSGMTLIIALIMLFMITMATIASFQMSKTNLDIVGNMQFQKEAVEASNSAIQEALSTTRMFTTPTTVFLNPCGVSNRRCYDFNNDGTNDVIVNLNPTPTCVQAQPIPNGSLLTIGAPFACAKGIDKDTFGIQGAATGNSLCANSTWEITAVATDTATQASVTVVEGAAVMVETDNILTSCP